MRRSIDPLTILKLTGLVAVMLVVLALAFGTLLPETFSRAQAAQFHGVEHAEKLHSPYAKKKKKRRKGRRGGTFDSDFGGGVGGGSYHTNFEPDP